MNSVKRDLRQEYPIIKGNNVYFLYNGKAESVYVIGDFNDWELVDKLTKVKDKDKWFIKKWLPIDAKIDYKFVVDQEWITDPHNRKVNCGEYVCNSSLTMPNYKNNYSFLSNANIHKGSIISGIEIYSKILQRTMKYRIYLPSDFNNDRIYDFIYVIDGNEYCEKAGLNLLSDYMIYKKEMPKSVIIFIDPPERNNDYNINNGFIQYIKTELIPHVENTYTVCRDYIKRTIVGASWGGFTAMYIAITSGNLISKVVSQSGTFWAKNWLIFDLIKDGINKGLEICIQTGISHNTEYLNDKMYNTLNDNGYKVHYQKFNEGDNWSNWRNHIYEAFKSIYYENHLEVVKN